MQCITFVAVTSFPLSIENQSDLKDRQINYDSVIKLMDTRLEINRHRSMLNEISAADTEARINARKSSTMHG